MKSWCHLPVLNFDLMLTLNGLQCILGSLNWRKNLTVMWFAGGRSMITSKAMIKPSLTARSSQYTSLYFPFSSRNALYLKQEKSWQKKDNEKKIEQCWQLQFYSSLPWLAIFPSIAQHGTTAKTLLRNIRTLLICIYIKNIF